MLSGRCFQTSAKCRKMQESYFFCKVFSKYALRVEGSFSRWDGTAVLRCKPAFSILLAAVGKIVSCCSCVATGEKGRRRVYQQEFSDGQGCFREICQQVINIQSITSCICRYVPTQVVIGRGHARDIAPYPDGGHPGTLCRDGGDGV